LVNFDEEPGFVLSSSGSASSVPVRVYEKKRRAYSINRIKSKLGYTPQYNMEKEIRKTIKWYREKCYI
jgi:dTDP-D-glucose 4,6-dehydratase